jgi:hypothetical protein
MRRSALAHLYAHGRATLPPTPRSWCHRDAVPGRVAGHGMCTVGAGISGPSGGIRGRQQAPLPASTSTRGPMVDPPPERPGHATPPLAHCQRGARDSLRVPAPSRPGVSRMFIKLTFEAATSEVVITGANLRIVNGPGRTVCGPEDNPIPDCPNGFGNLIVGYPKLRGDELGENIRTGPTTWSWGASTTSPASAAWSSAIPMRSAVTLRRAVQRGRRRLLVGQRGQYEDGQRLRRCGRRQLRVGERGRA